LPRSLRLGFAGTPPFAVPALDALARSAHRVVAVFTQPDRPAGRGRTVEAGAVKRCATALGIEVYQPPSLRTPDAQETLRDLQLDALVVVAYGLILPPAVLTLPVLGCFNIHASLLPRWRGAAPIQRALLAGDPVTGVTIMRMDAGLDTGPMLARREIAVAERETGATLHDRLSELGAALIVETLDAVAARGIREDAQPGEGATYAAKIHKAEAQIDWREDALQILRRVRAFNPWPVAETHWQGTQLRVWDAELAPADATAAPGRAVTGGAEPGQVIAASGTGIDVACGTGVLRILRLQLAGRKALAAGDFIKAQRLDGARFTTP
jgi:methionyl-tRNA formyltransferase